MDLLKKYEINVELTKQNSIFNFRMKNNQAYTTSLLALVKY